MAGDLFILSAPSGGGKSSLAMTLVEQSPDIEVSISHTTRAPRPGEVDGEHYHFVSEEDFKKLLAEDQFLEHARVFDHFYGTSHEAVRDKLAAGKHVLLDIDWQGMRTIKEKIPDATSIFILPPSREALRERLESRGQDDEQTISNRMQEAVSEMQHYSEFDYVVVNDNFNSALADLQAIIFGFPDQVRDNLPDMKELLSGENQGE
jgi:guanylate kinase